MGFEHYDSWKATDPRIEPEELERDEVPLYRLNFIERGTTREPFVRARWERLEARGKWLMLCSGSGSTWQAAIAALRDNLRERREGLRQHKPAGHWQYEFEHVSDAGEVVR